MKISAAQYEARRQFALAFKHAPRPDLVSVLGPRWSVGLEVHRLTDDEYFKLAVRQFNKRMGVRNFVPEEKHILYNLTGV